MSILAAALLAASADQNKEWGGSGRNAGRKEESTIKETSSSEAARTRNDICLFLIALSRRRHSKSLVGHTEASFFP